MRLQTLGAVFEYMLDESRGHFWQLYICREGCGMPMSPMRVYSYVTFDGNMLDRATLDEVRHYAETVSGLPVNVKFGLHGSIFTMWLSGQLLMLDRRSGEDRRHLDRPLVLDRRRAP